MITSKKHYTYLAGNISDDPRTYEWRIDFHREVSKRPRLDQSLCVLDPTANKFNQIIKPGQKGKKDLSSINMSFDKGGDFTGEEKEMLFEKALKARPGVLPKKDYGMIKICTVVIANLMYVHPQKPMIGTVFELDFCRMLMIPVVAIVDEEDPMCKLYSRHPFMNECISERVETVVEAVELIDDYFVFEYGEQE